MTNRAIVPTILLTASAWAQTPPVPLTPITPHNYPDLGTSVIDRDAAGTPITQIRQIELRHIDQGVYQTVVTGVVWPAGQATATTSLVAGTLDLTMTPPVWAPNADLDALNTYQPGCAFLGDEWQGSMSADGLVVVWDNYCGYSYPNNPGTPANSFIARRPATAAPFAVAQVWPLQGVPSGGSDPHIGEELPNGNVVVYYADFVTTGNIFKAEFDPSTGAMVGTPALAASQRPGSVLGHAPAIQRDSSGKARGLIYAEWFAVSGFTSPGLWRPGVDDSGVPFVIADAVNDPLFPDYINPAVVGGSVIYATRTGSGPYGDPSRGDFLMLTDADLSSGSGTICAFAPIHPDDQHRLFLSTVLIGSPVAPYNVPPILDPLEVAGGVPVHTRPMRHDPYTGRAEWTFRRLPNLGGMTARMQLVTLDVRGHAIRAANSAALILP